MKVNKTRPNNRNVIKMTAIAALLIAVAAGGLFGYGELRRLYIEQCEIVDVDSQVSITSGKMVRPENIAEFFGLRNGANLAEIDFERKRTDILSKMPTLRRVNVLRQLPDKVKIIAEERSPMARMNFVGNRNSTGKVVDEDGMVFICHRGSQTLPTIRESKAASTDPGHFVEGKVFSALQLLKACRNAEFMELGIQDIDTSKTDYLVATLGNYSKLKIAWDGMKSAPTPASTGDLFMRLRNLIKAIHSRIGSNAITWNATMPDMIFADTQGRQ